MMNKEVKARWVEALRCGEYQQGIGYLCEVRKDGTERFCCLGVLVDIEHDGDWELGGDYGDKYGVENNIFLPPESLTKGIAPEEVDTLTEMNDVENMSFEEIADWIEENL